MTPALVFDLETIPDAEGLRKLNGWGADVPDAEVVERALAARREAVGHDFLPLHLHKVAVIGCVFRDDQGLRVKTLGQADDPEAALLAGFFKTIERYTPKLVSWNGSGFDLPVLHYRALRYGIAAPRYWDTGDDDPAFRWNNYLSRFHWRHIDLMDVLSGYQSRACAPLDELAVLLGFPGKLGMSGARVWESYLAGDLAGIRNYCETDVLNTYLVYLRFELMRGRLSRERHDEECALLREHLAQAGQAHFQEFLQAWPAK